MPVHNVKIYLQEGAEDLRMLTNGSVFTPTDHSVLLCGADSYPPPRYDVRVNNGWAPTEEYMPYGKEDVTRWAALNDTMEMFPSTDNYIVTCSAHSDYEEEVTIERFISVQGTLIKREHATMP